MFCRYGAYTHSDNEVNLVSFSHRVIHSDRGRPGVVRKTAKLEGVLIASTQANIKSAIQSLQAAYTLQGRDWGLYHDNGTASPHILVNADSLSGVRVVELSFPKGDGAEYATQRTYSITLEATYAASNEALHSFSETLSIQGDGGPRFVVIPVLNGPPQKQITHQATPVTAQQTGQAVGMFAYPSPAPPIFPFAEKRERRTIATQAPRSEGNQFVLWPISWSYYFESPTPLSGTAQRI
jgi:hypothetical protein